MTHGKIMYPRATYDWQVTVHYGADERILLPITFSSYRSLLDSLDDVVKAYPRATALSCVLYETLTHEDGSKMEYKYPRYPLDWPPT